MTALAIERMTDFAGLIPSRGTYPIAADTKIFKGGIVCLNASGQAVQGGDADALFTVGKASATFDNTGGSAAALDVEVEFGVFGYVGSGITAASVGKVVYVSDDQTVALTGTVAAGILTEYRNSQAYVWMGPHVPVSPKIQKGSGTLVAGVLAVTGVTVTSASVIVCARKTAAGTAGDEIVAPTADRTVAAGTGAFTARSLLDGVAATSDTSTFEWLIVG